MSAITRVLMLGLLSYLMVGCRGGGDPMANIVSVSPTGTVGITTGSVEFTADVDAPGSYELQWDLGGGADPDSPVDLSPLVDLLDPGPYEATVRLVIDSIVVDTFPFEYTVAAIPEVTAVSPEGSAGLVRGLVDFEATVDGDFDSLSWTFDDGATLRSQEEAIAHVRLQGAGTYEGTVTPTLDGVSGSAFPFEYTVDAPVAPTWTVQDVAPASFEFSEAGTSITLHSGKLAIAYTGPNGGVRLARAKTAAPCCPSDWDIHEIDPLGQVRGSQSLVSQSGRLIVAYRAQEDALASIRLWVAVAKVEEPASSDDWWHMDMEGFSGYALLSRDGETPVMATGGPPKGLNFWVAQAEHPESLEEWLVHSIRSESEPGQLLIFPLQLAKSQSGFQIGMMPEGVPSVLFASTDLDLPSDSTDWTVSAADPRQYFDRSVFPIYEGPDGPQLLFAGPNESILSQVDLVLLQGKIATPTSPPDWVRTSVISAIPRSPLGGDKSAAGSGGVWAERSFLLRPAWVNNELLLYRQVGNDPSRVDAWESSIVDGLGAPGVAVAHTIAGDTLASSYVDFATGMLRLAVSSREA